MDPTTHAVLKNAPKIQAHAKRIRAIAHTIDGNVSKLLRAAKEMPQTSALGASVAELRAQVYALCKQTPGGATFSALTEATGASEPRVRFALAALRKSKHILVQGNRRTMRYLAKGPKSARRKKTVAA